MIIDDCDKHDDDNCDDDCGNMTSCSVSITDLESLMFPFLLVVGDFYNIALCLKSCPEKSSLGLGS